MIALFLGLAYAETASPASKPTQVVVFADRARVTRTVSVELPAGRNEVQFVGLPASILAGSFTADLRGAAVVRGIDARLVPAAVTADEQIRVLDAKIVAAQDKRQSLEDRIAAERARIGMLDKGRAQSAQALSTQLLYGDAAAGTATSVRGSLGGEDADARGRIRALEIERRGVDDGLGALQRERAALGVRGVDTWTATVRLDVERAGRLAVDLSYMAGNAGWVPRYDVRGDADKKKVEVALSAMIQQGTGEDWDDVRLVVSSAQPNLGTTVPRLDPFWLERPRPMPRPAPPMKSSMAGGPRAPAAESMAVEDVLEKPMVVAQATVQVELAATTFEVARPEDVPDEAGERKVLLTTTALDAKLRWVTVPRLDSRAFLVAEVENTAGFPLLAGEAGAFLGGGYLGDFSLPTVAPGETFDVAFGVDDRVSIERVPKKIVTDGAGAVGKRAKARWDWEVRVRNGRKAPIDLVIVEQVPLSNRDDVVVTLLPGTPAPVREDDGRVELRLVVGAGASTTATWGYQIEYPSDLSLGWME